ncbi:efflux RND transporter periplasmic adaptor subunit [Pedobacter cryotolerans]|uniref:Efflux RND transporter periplasmic adaptor subunit n=1 Tax=Pedobacter cryotolerans TaxID=2571270 RepID=A0A4U1C800_9SPHI|nr:efflux RND transporter periplasmic adaptor subunit [Pedobacter cryotolerans]TKC01718.1 efflux RND transporter periplasmic adaptor subunit [Pedobacter cryotolerans]
MKTRYIYFVLLFLFSCTAKEQEVKEEQPIVVDNKITFTDAQLKSAGLTFVKLEEQKMASVLRLNGKIDVPPQNMVSISVPMGGYLKNTKLLPGMHVNKGEVIATIEDQQYIQLQQDYLLTKSKIAFSKLEYERQKELNQSKATSDKVFQQATAEYNSLTIMLSSLGEKLKLIGKNPSSISEKNISRSISIYAPIDGFVTKVNVNIGKYVSPTDVLFELVNPTDIHLAINVFEKDLGKLFIGQEVVTYTNNDPKNKHLAEILLIGKDLGEDRSTEVHCHFEDYDKTLIPGTYMNAEVQIKANNSFVLPEDAVVSFENKNYAFVKKSAKEFEMISVQTGVVENGFIEVLNGKQLANQTFVQKGAYTLLMTIKNKAEEE